MRYGFALQRRMSGSAMRLSMVAWVRTLVMVRIHGVETVAKMHENRLRVVMGMDLRHIGGSDA